MTDEAQVAAEVAELKATRKARINLTWEYTQAFIAISLVMGTIYTEIAGTRPSETLKNALFAVIGFYFGRTNHARLQDPNIDS